MRLPLAFWKVKPGAAEMALLVANAFDDIRLLHAHMPGLAAEDEAMVAVHWIGEKGWPRLRPLDRQTRARNWRLNWRDP